MHQNDYKPALAAPIQRTGFTPNKNDDDGLSVHRELFITPEKLAWCGRKPGEYVIIRMLAGDLMATPLNFEITPSPANDVPGHALIPQLSFSTDKAMANQVKDLARKLAVAAGSKIAYVPPKL